MYSDEISKTLKSQNYNIDSNTYLIICQSSPQISRIKYNPYEDSFDMWTKDNFHWQFTVYRKETKK